MRILSAGNMYPPHSLGGYEEMWRSAARHLREHGHEVRVLTTDFRLDGAAGQPEDPDVHRELRWYWRVGEFPRLGLPRVLSLERHNRRLFDLHLRDFSPDVVSWWGMGGMSLSLLDRTGAIPAVGFVHDDWLVYANQVDRWTRLRSRLGRRFEPNEKATWVFNSEHTRGIALSARPGLARTGVAHPGIDPAVFGPAHPQDWRWRLLYVGRLDPRKGVDVAIEALKGLPVEATLTVVGGGDEAYRRELEALIARLGLTERVRMLGTRPRADLPAIYAAADAVVFPVTWEEPFGLVPLEAMAVGRPVVASGTGGSAEYLRERQNCVLASPGDPAALTLALESLAADGELRERLRTSGLETAAGFTEDAFNRSVEDWLSRAVRSQPG